MNRLKPNILITGTPCTGKSTLCQALKEELADEIKVINISEFAKEHGLLEEYDSELDTMVLDEDSVIDELEDQLTNGGIVVDYHSSNCFPERWFDIIFVLRTDNSILHERLEKRNYSEKKISNNIECEIFQVSLDEAKDSYAENIVHQLKSETAEDMEANIEQIKTWFNQYVKQRN